MDWSLYGRHTPLFSWAGLTKTARLVAVHDSDTCRVVFDTGLGVKQVIIRVQGIDGPEMNTKDADEKSHAILARDSFLQIAAPHLFSKHGNYSQKQIVEKLASSIVLVTLELGQPDKYGRTLAKVVSNDGVDIGQRLLDTGDVHAYFGGTKEHWVF